MNVGLIYPPYTPVFSQRGSASLHIAHLISILKEECTTSDVRYVDFNMIPFYLYSLAVSELLRKPETMDVPVHLLEEEKMWIIDRIVLENAFDAPQDRKINTFFHVDQYLVEGLQKILHKLLKSMVDRISVMSLDAVCLFTSPTICYTLQLIDLIRKRDADIPLMLFDNYTFEPATPYFASFITHKDMYGNDISNFLEGDPLSPLIEKKIYNLVDWIVIGEGYDVVRMLFNSRNAPPLLEGMRYSADEFPIPEKVNQKTLLHDRSLRIVSSHLVDLDSLPFPDYTLMEEVYACAEIEVTRGCPYECVFCERSGMFQNIVRSHSLQYMDRLVSHLKQYDFQMYTFIDAALNVDEKAVLHFLEMLKENSFKYQANLRGKHPNETLIKLLKSTGCEEIALGMETADDSVLKSMNKIQNLAILGDLITSIGRHEIPLLLFLIVGFPTETPASVRKTTEFIEHIASHSHIDCIEGELYHVGHIQKLKPALYNSYGIEWKCNLSVENVERASRFFTEPGLFGLAYFTQGMNRIQLNNCIRMYIDAFTHLGIQHEICQPWSDNCESNHQ